MAQKDAKIDRLAKVPVFAGCGRKELQAIASISDEVVIDSGDTVITQGEHLHYAYVIEEGSGAVDIDGNSAGEVSAGEILGEISMFDPAPAAATVTATTSMRLLVIRQDEFEETIRHHPDLAISLLKTMAKRFRDFKT